MRLTLGMLFVPLAAFAADSGTDVQKLDKGEINWSQKTITATGSGTFSNSSSNAAQARLGATKAAKMDAQRNLLEMLKGVNISSKTTLGTAMASTDIKAKVEGVVRNFEVVDTKYFSDGGVDVVIRMSLDGSLADAVVPAAATPAPVAGTDSGYTGLIIDARGTQVQPALSPRLVDEAGKELYSAANVNKDKLHDHGVAAYVKTIDAAKADKRVGAKPLTVRVQKLAAGGKTDLVVAAKDAGQISGPFLSEGNVVIITD
jgi:hypothetical protein